MRRNQLAVGAIDHVHETVLVGTQQRLADLTIDTQIGKHRLGRAVEVEAFIWNVLIVPNQVAGLRPDRDHARRIKTVSAAAIGRVVWLRIAGAPIDQVKLRVIRTVLPSRPTAVFPCLGHIFGPGFRAGSARSWYGVPAP